MANITGTNGADILTGTSRDPQAVYFDGSGGDSISALDGDDRIIGTTGADSIDGGAGYDVLDFSNINDSLLLSFLDNRVINPSYAASRFGLLTPDSIVSSFTNIEKIIANPAKSNTITDFSRRFFITEPTHRVDIDLAKGKLNAVEIASGKTISNIEFENFDNVAVASTGRVIGNDRNNEIRTNLLDSGSIIVGSKGNDTLWGNTIDYSNFSQGIKLSLKILSPLAPIEETAIVDKGDLGQDTIQVTKKIIGAAGKINTFDASNAYTTYSIDLNLATGSLTAISSYGNKTVELVNFSNAIGTQYNDKIVGANVASTLTGGGGSDTIVGGMKNDKINGTDAITRGVGEVDTLTGGGGRDRFVLGDSNGAFYVGNGVNDYALITDFNIFQDSLDLGIFKNYSFAISGKNTIDIFAGKDAATRDLVAKVQLANIGIAATAKSSVMSLGTDSSSLNPLLAQLNFITTGTTESLA